MNTLPITAPTSKYFDWEKQKVINENDICEYANWVKSGGKYSCTLHHKGFKIFIPKEDINSSDEYADDDPYGFDLNNIFHKARVESTLYLIGSVFGKGDRFKLLDIGCGKGIITDQICKTFPYSEISALDYSVSSINFAVENFKNIDFIVADAYNLPYSKDYYDIVICNNIWEHVPDPLNMLKSIKKVLKIGGCLLISTPNRYRMSNLLGLFRGKPIQLMSKMHVTEYSIGQVIEQLKYGGFETINIYGQKNYKINGIRSWIVFNLIRPILKLLLTCIKLSSYMIDSTFYILAIKGKKTIINGHCT